MTTLLAHVRAAWRAFNATVDDLLRQLDEWVERQQ